MTARVSTQQPLPTTRTSKDLLKTNRRLGGAVLVLRLYDYIISSTTLRSQFTRDQCSPSRCFFESVEAAGVRRDLTSFRKQIE
jgi:hypothetical protein